MFKRLLGVLALLFCLVLPATSQAEGLKVGFVNMRKVFYEYKKTKEFNAKLEKEDEKVKREIENKTKDIRKLRDEFDLLSDDAKKKKEPQLRAKIKELDDFRKEKIEEFIRKKDEMFKDIRQNILDTADSYAKKNGYDIIFDQAIFVYSSPKYDLTDKIIAILNK